MSKNILIIDDDFSLRRVIEKALKNSKTNIKSVSTISEAWVDIEKNRLAGHAWGLSAFSHQGQILALNQGQILALMGECRKTPCI